MQVQRFDIFFKRLFILLFMIGIVYAIYLMTPIIVPFLAAFVLAYLLNPIVVVLARYMSRFTATMLVYAMIIAVIVLVVRWAVPVLWAQAKIMWDYIPVAIDWYNDTGRVWIGKRTNSELLPFDVYEVREQALLYLQNNYQVSDAQSIVMKVVSQGLSIMNKVGVFVLIPILTFYFLMNWYERLGLFANAIPAEYRKKTLEIAKDCDKALMSFVQGQLLVMVLLGITYAVQLHFIGLELGITIGLIAGIASFVPYLGFGVGIIAAMVAGLLQFGLDWVKLAMIGGAFMVGQAVEGYVLQPLLLGDKIGLSPLWVMFSVLAGASLFGFVGMLIALPVSALINVLFRHAYGGYLNSEWYKGRRQYRLFD